MSVINKLHEGIEFLMPIVYNEEESRWEIGYAGYTR